MASISMNPTYDRATFAMMNTLKHGHQWAVVKGVLVSLAIIAVGFFTMVMPAIGPATDGAASPAAQSNSDVSASDMNLE